MGLIVWLSKFILMRVESVNAWLTVGRTILGATNKGTPMTYSRLDSSLRSAKISDAKSLVKPAFISQIRAHLIRNLRPLV